MATNNVGQVQSLFPTTTTNTTQYDPLLMGTLTDIINAARTQANTPYQAYPGQRYAQLTPEELQANQAVRDNFLKTQPMYDTAGNLINQGTSQLNNLTQNMGQWNQGAAQQYMNPYISNVVQAQTNNMLNNANIERNRIRSNAAQAGAFGGGRQFVAEQQMNDDLNRRLDDTTSNLMMQGYNTAYDQFNKDRQFGLEGVKQYGAQADLNSALAGARNTAYYGDVNNLNTVGQNLRDIAQANLDYDYSNFQNQRDYGKNQLGWISGLLNGTNLGQFQTGSTTTNRTQLPAAKSSFTNDLMTGLGYAANLANTDIGKSVGSWISSWFANGGYVQAKNKYAKGGEVSYRGKDANKISVPDDISSLETNFKDKLDYSTGAGAPFLTLEVPSLEGLDLNNLIDLQTTPNGYKVTLRNTGYAKGGEVKKEKSNFGYDFSPYRENVDGETANFNDLLLTIPALAYKGWSIEDEIHSKLEGTQEESLKALKKELSLRQEAAGLKPTLGSISDKELFILNGLYDRDSRNNKFRYLNSIGSRFVKDNGYAKGGEVKGYAEGGFSNYDVGTLVDQMQRLKGVLPRTTDTNRLIQYTNQLKAMEQELAARRGMLGLQPTTDLPVPGIAGGMFNPNTGERVDTGAGLAGPPILAGRGVSDKPTTITEMLDNEITAVNQPDNLPVGVSELMLPQQEEISLNDLFTYSGGPLDALMQPNPLIMQGLYGKMTSGDLGEMWRAAGQIDAMNNYEDMRSGRMQTDTQRGAAIGELAERRTARKQTNALEQRKLELEEKAASQTDPLKQAQIMKIMAEINAMGETKPATAKDTIEMLSKVLDMPDSTAEQKAAAQRGLDAIMAKMGLLDLSPEGGRSLGTAGVR